MKATGIVRRIDDLGRIVIPKEIRRSLHIREGDPLEIFLEKDGGVVFKKYSIMGEFSSYAKQMQNALSSNGIAAAILTMMEFYAGRVPLELQEFPMTGLIFAVRRQNGKVCLLHQFL